MKNKIWYSIRNGGDGGAYLRLMESKELVEIDQKYENISGEGWADSCCGVIVVESDLSIFIKEVVTVDAEIDNVCEEMKYSIEDELDNLKNKLTELKAL